MTQGEFTALLFGIIGGVFTWTLSVVAAMIWLNGKFRHVEKTIYQQLDRLKREYDVKLNSHSIKIMRLEIKAFGFTMPELPHTPEDSSKGPNGSA